MARQALQPGDERLNELSDRDALWGPLLGIRPDKKQVFSVARVLALAVTVGGFYGILLNLGLMMVCRLARLQPPSVYGVPSVLTFTYFVGFMFTLGPAWNRRARLLARRADYMRRIGRPSDQPH